MGSVQAFLHHIKPSRPPAGMLACLVTFSIFASAAQAQTVYAHGGSLTVNLDGNAFANGADAAYLSSFDINLTPGQTFMEFARHFTPAETMGLSVLDFRPQPNPPVVDFNDLRASWNRPASSNLAFAINNRDPIGTQPAGRAAQPTTFSFDPANVTATAAGAIGTIGTSSFWYANDAMIATGSIWLAFGDLSIQYSAARAAGGNSGWYFINNLLFPQDLFDTQNVSLSFNGGELTISGDLVVSQELRDAFALQEGLNVGNFQMIAAVPEPGTLSLVLVGALGGLGYRWRHRRKRKTKS